ncbi:MAG: 2-phospho-L-lactate guanylyltransferase [Candidatus Dormibacteria bacterium]|jgi:2-phospho-L-lactate guanylyltransferase
MVVEPFLVVPVKPSSGSKQRLASALPDPGRELISLTLAVRVISLAAQVWPAGTVVVVSSEPGLTPICQRLGVARIADSGAGQTAAVRSGVCWSLERGATVVATVAADLPGVGTEDLLHMLRTARGLAPGAMAIYSDREGSGTNGVVVRPGSLLVHSFGPGSRRRHERIAAQLGLRFRVEDVAGLQWDLDRPEDLESTEAASSHPLLSWAVQLSQDSPQTARADVGG